MRDIFLKTLQITILLLFTSVHSGIDFSGPPCEMSRGNCSHHGITGQNLCCCPPQREAVETSGEIETAEYLIVIQELPFITPHYDHKPVFFKKTVFSSFHEPLKTIRLLM